MSLARPEIREVDLGKRRAGRPGVLFPLLLALSVQAVDIDTGVPVPRPPHLRAFVGGHLSFGAAPSLGAGIWGPDVDLGIQVNEAFGVYASARLTTVMIILAPTQVSASALAEWTTPFRLSLATGAGWLWTYVPPMVDQASSQSHAIAFPVRVSYDFGKHTGVRLSLEGGVAPFFSSQPFFWGGLAVGYSWR